ncbi:hypothetical protein PHJA_000063500 [Phtheirospermum japonicum]|uniref:Uncharacterized protein n=1 Tax=Phtheirospermum japonicum TaxID=374723 RepID=A0A830AX58_9LAMI|nr:hypothetical protein PHJA_000063500 [Phtheirospermum japonicum]
MGQGEENKTRAEPSIEIQERGEIFFFYRPKVNKEEAHGPEDVQRLYLVLRPESGERRVEDIQDTHSAKQASKQAAVDVEEEDHKDGCSQKVNIEKQPLLRYIVMGRKSLPDPNHNKSSPYWGFVQMVTTEIQQVKDALKGEEYETATRGHRHLPDSRAVGEGVYRILRHINTGKRKNDNNNNMHTHLIYKLEYPAEGEEGGPQEALNIAREASFIIQIKNPQASTGPRQGLDKKRKATFPAHMQGLLGHQRFHPADPPDFLNYEGCEFLLISASDDIEQELGLELKAEQQQQQQHDEDDADTFGDDVAPTRPLFRGTWL